MKEFAENNRQLFNTMNTIKKFTSFEELKSSEKNTNKSSLSLIRHKNFEQVIMDIRSVRAVSVNQKRPK